MDSLLKSVSELMKISGFDGPKEDFKSSSSLVLICRKKGFIADVRNPSDINRNSSDEYFTHLCALAKKFLFEHPELKNWQKFKLHPANKKVHKILHEFGVARGAGIFSDDPEANYEPVVEGLSRVTLEQLYEVYQIKFNFDGSFLAFKKQIHRIYGSYAEYCLIKGLDINTTKWDSEETALRVARKLGSSEQVKLKCPSLYKYLESKKLITVAFAEVVA